MGALPFHFLRLLGRSAGVANIADAFPAFVDIQLSNIWRSEATMGGSKIAAPWLLVFVPLR